MSVCNLQERIFPGNLSSFSLDTAVKVGRIFKSFSKLDCCEYAGKSGPCSGYIKVSDIWGNKKEVENIFIISFSTVSKKVDIFINMISKHSNIW